MPSSLPWRKGEPKRAFSHFSKGKRKKFGDRIEYDMRTLQALGPGTDVTVFDIYHRAHRLQSLYMKVYGSGANRAAAGQRHVGFAEARDQRTQHKDGCAHRFDELIGRSALTDTGSVDLDIQLLIECDLDTHALQQGNHGRNVLQLRNIANRHRRAGQKCAREDRQRRILGAGHVDRAGQGHTTFDQELVQNLGFASVAEILPFRGGVRADGHRMNFVAHQAAETPVNELVPRNRPLAFKGRGNDQRRVMRVVVTEHLDRRVIEPVFDQGLDFFGFHL